MLSSAPTPSAFNAQKEGIAPATPEGKLEYQHSFTAWYSEDDFYLMARAKQGMAVLTPESTPGDLTRDLRLHNESPQFSEVYIRKWYTGRLKDLGNPCATDPTPNAGLLQAELQLALINFAYTHADTTDKADLPDNFKLHFALNTAEIDTGSHGSHWVYLGVNMSLNKTEFLDFARKLKPAHDSTVGGDPDKYLAAIVVCEEAVKEEYLFSNLVITEANSVDGDVFAEEEREALTGHIGQAFGFPGGRTQRSARYVVANTEEERYIQTNGHDCGTAVAAMMLQGPPGEDGVKDLQTIRKQQSKKMMGLNGELKEQFMRDSLLVHSFTSDDIRKRLDTRRMTWESALGCFNIQPERKFKLNQDKSSLELVLPSSYQLSWQNALPCLTLTLPPSEPPAGEAAKAETPPPRTAKAFLKQNTKEKGFDVVVPSSLSDEHKTAMVQTLAKLYALRVIQAACDLLDETIPDFSQDTSDVDIASIVAKLKQKPKFNVAEGDAASNLFTYRLFGRDQKARETIRETLNKFGFTESKPRPKEVAETVLGPKMSARH